MRVHDLRSSCSCDFKLTDSEVVRFREKTNNFDKNRGAVDIVLVKSLRIVSNFDSLQLCAIVKQS